MPRPGRAWYHLIWGTHGSWLPGDPRGFRSTKHRLHSSGDYKNPPPPGEHARLHAHVKRRAAPAVRLSLRQRRVVLALIVAHLRAAEHRPLAASAGATHVHLLAELPAGRDAVRRACRAARTNASRLLPDKPAGQLWAAGYSPIEVRGPAHQRNAFRYIARGQEADAAVWTFRELVPLLDEEIAARLPDEVRAQLGSATDVAAWSVLKQAAT